MRVEWSSDEHEIFLRMVKKGEGSLAISDALPDRSRSSVLSHANHNGIKFTCASALTDEEEGRLTELIKQGLSWAKIAVDLDKSNTTVRNAAKRLGLKKKWCSSYAPLKPKLKHNPRKCLKCQKPFSPAARNFYVCTPCKSTADWHDGQYMQDVI